MPLLVSLPCCTEQSHLEAFDPAQQILHCQHLISGFVSESRGSRPLCMHELLLCLRKGCYLGAVTVSFAKPAVQLSQSIQQF